MSEGASRERFSRLAVSFLVLLGTVAASAKLLHWLGSGEWSFGEALYMAVNAVSTAGFSELSHFREIRFAPLATVFIILAGLCAVAYFQSTVTALLVEGLLGERFRRRRMQRRIDTLSGHYIVAGAGATGVHVIE